MSNRMREDAAEVERTTIRKVRARIIPFIFVLYIVAFLDRANITMAALTMNNELGVSPAQYSLLSGLFFIGYFLLEVPSNLMMHRVGARVWIARILVTWGAVAMIGGLVRGVHELYAVRFLLGAAEAGFAPGMLLYLTYWFPRREQARAVGLYLAAIPVAGILGAPISGLILDNVHWLGLSSWRWVLILEGFPAVALGIATYLVLPGSPDQARFLTSDQTQWLTTTLAADAEAKGVNANLSLLQTLRCGRVWRLTGIYFGMLMGLYAATFYGPLLVKEVSTTSSNTAIGLLAMIPALVGLVAMILVARNSDRMLERRYHVAAPAAIAGAALVSLSAVHSTLGVVGLLGVAAIGIYGFFGPFWALPNEFLSGASAAAGLALINSFGNLAGFVSPIVIGAITAKTGTYAGGLALAGTCMFAAAILVARLRRLSPVETIAGPWPANAGEAI
jgi:ACS family tartrate transporter-like MFS transporter